MTPSGRAYLAFIPASLDDSALSPQEFRVYCRLARRTNSGRWGAYESIDNMARALKISHNTVRRCLGRLIDLAMLRAERRPGRTTKYFLLPQSDWKFDPDPRRDTSETLPVPSEGHPPLTNRGQEVLERQVLENLPSEGQAGLSGRDSLSKETLREQKSKSLGNEAEAVSATKFQEVKGVLSEVNKLLGLRPPTDSDVRRNLRKEGGLRELVQIEGRELAIQFFVRAWKKWEHGCSWEAVFAQRERLKRELHVFDFDTLVERFPPSDPEQLVDGVDYWVDCGGGRYVACKTCPRGPGRNPDDCPHQFEGGCKGQRIATGGVRSKIGVNGERLAEPFDLEQWKAAREDGRLESNES